MRLILFIMCLLGSTCAQASGHAIEEPYEPQTECLHGVEITDENWQRYVTYEDIYDVVSEYVSDHGCTYCTEDRFGRYALRDSVEELSRERTRALTRDEKMEFSRLIVEGHIGYGVPYSVLLGTAWHETNFDFRAPGAGGELGPWQQTPIFAPETQVRAAGCTPQANGNPRGGHCGRQAWTRLYSLYSNPGHTVSVLTFSNKYWDLVSDHDDNWECVYNQGGAGIRNGVCRNDARAYRIANDRAERLMERELRERVTQRVEVECDASRIPCSQHTC
jgi:hypothetical protein